MSRYRKALIAAIFAGITTAATYYDFPWLQIASAVVTPLAVYFIPNTAPADYAARVEEYAP